MPKMGVNYNYNITENAGDTVTNVTKKVIMKF